MNIIIRFYSKYNVSCIDFVRSSPAPRHNCALGPRDQVAKNTTTVIIMVLIIIIVNIITILNIQVNQITSYLDGSNLYGSSSTDQVLILDIYYSLFFIILSQVKILDISYSLFINDSSFIINLPLTSTG